MERAISIHDAKIQTVSIEIQTMRIGKKQVTLSVFRQLPEYALVDPKTVQLRGLPWGHVNYWWDGEYGNVPPHRRLHVVWQRGEQLCRSICYEEPPGRMINAFRRQQLPLMRQWFLLLLRATPSIEQFHIPRRQTSYDDAPEASVNGRKIWLDFTISESAWLQEYCHWRDYAGEDAWGQRRKSEIHAWYLQMLAESDVLDVAPQVMAAALDAAEHEERQYRHQWSQQWHALCDLPQLFIAV